MTHTGPFELTANESWELTERSSEELIFEHEAGGQLRASPIDGVWGEYPLRWTFEGSADGDTVVFEEYEVRNEDHLGAILQNVSQVIHSTITDSDY